MNTPILWMVIPCYNEEKVLPITAPIFLEKLNNLIIKGLINAESKILFINDGSKDNTWKVISELSNSNDKYLGISQSRNRGHQNAVLAGLMEAKRYCDITISLDCDGQDDVNAIDDMIREYMDGAEIVYGVRSNRDSDTWFKKTSAQGFYKIMNALGVETIYNHSDYRLITSRVLDEFENFKEVNLFLRGMIPLVGFRSTSVYYKRNERIAGESKYPFSKMLSLALDGITSLSIKPIRVVTSIGFVVSILGFLGILWAIFLVLTNNVVAGWASTVCIILFLGGIQLLSLGIIGEYIGKTYLETKARPRYIISERTYQEKKQ